MVECCGIEHGIGLCDSVKRWLRWLRRRKIKHKAYHKNKKIKKINQAPQRDLNWNFEMNVMDGTVPKITKTSGGTITRTIVCGVT